MANANVKFFKGTCQPTTDYIAGGIYFDSSTREIRLGKGGVGAYDAYGNGIKDAVLSGNKLTISFHDTTKSDIVLDFSDIASASGTTIKFKELADKIAALEAKAPEAGHDIKIGGKTAEDETSINVALENAITVMGVSVGTLANGSKLDKGMSLSDILKKILIREIDAVVGSNPSTGITVTGVTKNDTYEVGTSLTATLSHTYTDGKFVGADSLYSYNLPAGCAEGTTTYKFDTTTVTSPHSLTVTEGSHKFNCSTTYGASTASPVKNNGNASTAHIPAGTATSGDFTFTGKFYGYVGYSDKSNATEYNASDLTEAKSEIHQFLNVNSETTLVGGTAKTSNGKSIFIAFPSKYHLKSVSNGLGADIKANFSSTAKISYVHENTTTEYTVLVYPITNGAEVEFKNLVISK